MARGERAWYQCRPALVARQLPLRRRLAALQAVVWGACRWVLGCLPPTGAAAAKVDAWQRGLVVRMAGWRRAPGE
eukprot:8276082-Prorocentrum_lima.AAC.1